jgi:hypothetical protein
MIWPTGNWRASDMGVRLGFRLGGPLWVTAPLQFRPLASTDRKLAPRTIWDLMEALVLGFGMVTELLVLRVINEWRTMRMLF